MATVEVTYSVLVNPQSGETVPINLYNFSTTLADTRQQWVEHVVQDLQPGRSGLDTIRACKIVLNIDGTVNISAVPTLPAENDRYVYPHRFRIPPDTVEDLPLEEQVIRAEMFAFGTLLYHIYSGRRPFDDLPDDSVEERFANAEFPADRPDTLDLDQWPMILYSWSFEFARDILYPFPSSHKPFDNLQDDSVEERFANAELSADTLDLDQWPIILSRWSLEFARDLHDRIPTTTRDRVLNHIKAHPYLSALKASGVLLSAVSLGAPLILGAAGFSAVGPVAGSAAAAWQSSTGLVQAGSFFAWCQSAAMGGAAVGGVVATGTVGASAAAGATLAEFVTKKKVGNMTVRERYGKAFRKGPQAK